MSKSKIASQVAFVAVLALISHPAAAVQLAANSNSAGISGSQSKEAPSMQAVSSSPENQRAVVKTKGNVKDNRSADADANTLSNDVPALPPAAMPSESRTTVVKTKGNIKNNKTDAREESAMPNDAAATTDAATSSETRRAVVKTKGNVKNQRSANSDEVSTLPSAGQPAEGKLKGKVVTVGTRASSSDFLFSSSPHPFSTPARTDTKRDPFNLIMAIAGRPTLKRRRASLTCRPF